MSGTTAAKITGLAVDGATPLASGATLRLRWTAYAAGDDFRAEGSNDGGKTFTSWGRTGGPATSFSKGGLPDGEWRARIVARRGGSDITGSTSDAITVRIGPVPAPAPQPAPAPAPTPAGPSAADFAALRDRVAALEARNAADIQANGTLGLVVEGQPNEIPATAKMTLTPVPK